MSAIYQRLRSSCERVIPKICLRLAVVRLWADDRLAQLKSPTLVIVGEQDLLTPPWICREVADRIPGSQFEIIKGAGSSHVVPIERSDEFNALVTRFLVASESALASAVSADQSALGARE